MDIAKPESPDGIGSIKAAISIYGERFHGRKPDEHRSLTPLSEDSQSKPRKIRLVQFDIENLNESKKFSETEKAIPSKELAQLIQESDTKARAHSIQHQNLKKPQRSKANDTNQSNHSTVIQELDRAKEELSLLKINVASLLQDKAKSEKDAEDSNSRLKSYESMAEELRKEIDEVDEEYVLVELARIEAERERREIEAQKEAEATHFLSYIEIARNKIKHLQTEIDRAKELEAKLAEANSDVSVLQNEMEFVRACREQNPKKDVDKEKQENSSRLQSAVAELNSAKQELESIRREGFQFMASMDLVREEIMQIAIENQELKHLETKANSTVHSLSSKLRKAKSKLESAASIADGKSTIRVSNLSQALQRLQTKISEAKREKETIRGALETITAEIEKTNIHNESAEEGLEAATRELQLVKESEADAMKKLRDASDTVMKNRATASLNGSPVTVSICKFEYDYLRRRAAASRRIADKKVAAARAWVEALRAEEKEILMKCEHISRENKEQELREPLDVDAETSNKQLMPAMPRKSIRENGTQSGRAKTRRSLSTSGTTRQISRSPSFTMRKKTTVLGSALCHKNLRSAKQQVSGPEGSN